MNLRLLIVALSLAALGLSTRPDEGPSQGRLSFVPISESKTHLEWGGDYVEIVGLTPRGRVELHYVKIDPRRFRLAIALPPKGIGTLSSLDEMISHTGAVVGINANFFDPKTALPIGFLLKDAQVLGTPYGRRATLAIGFFGNLYFLNPRISLLLRTPQGSIPLDGINRPLASDALIAYTAEYRGPRGLWDEALVYSVRGDRIVSIGSGRSIRAQGIAEDGYWLVAHGRAKERVAGLLPAEQVRLDYEMEPELPLVRDALQAGPMLWLDGELALSREGFPAELVERPAARSALARTHNGALLLLIVPQGGRSVGMSLMELAEALKILGAVDALALDGGSSSTLGFRRGGKVQTLGSGRPIPVGLVLLPR